MKYIIKAFLSFICVSLVWTLTKEFAQSETAIQYTHWIYRIPFWYQVLLCWIVFSFPDSVGNILRTTGNGVVQAASYAAAGAGKTIDHVWQYNAGKIIIAAGGLYLLYRCFY